VIYLDANATTPLLPEVLEAMLPWLTEGFHNPNASYRGAKEARKAIETAREQVAALIGANPDEVVFTGGGTESTNTAIKWLARLVGRKTGRVITSAIEHSAVLKPCEALQDVGFPVDQIPVSSLGRLDLMPYRSACETARVGGGFASIMWANNETGVVQPIEEACALAREHGVAFHTDAIQAVGKIPVDVRQVPVDFLSLSGHKFHGPKGVGALYIRNGCRFEPMVRGGGQEKGRRSGTENTAAIVGLGKAAELAMQRLEAGTARVSEIRDAFETALVATISGCEINGDPAYRLPGTSHVSFDGCEAAGLLILLDDLGVACSAGSACMTGKQQPSHVQKAMGFSDAKAKSSLRFGFSFLNTKDEALKAATAVAAAVGKLRHVQGSGVGPVTIYTP
jgi:cysteine desulfurase